MSLKEQLDIFKKQMENWEACIGLRPSRIDPEDADTVLNLSRTQLMTRSIEALAQDAFVLSQFAFALQQKENQCRAFQEWYRANHNRIDSNTDATFASKLLEDATYKIARITYLGRRVEFMIQSISGLVRSRSTK